MSGVIDKALLATLSDEERGVINNILCAPTLTVFDGSATGIEVAAAQATIDAVVAMLRARLVYLLASGGES